MTTAYIWPAGTAASAVDHHLSAARACLRTAAQLAEDLVAHSARYRGTAGWDIEIAINTTLAHVGVAARIHDLAHHDPRRTRRAIHDTAAAEDSDRLGPATLHAALAGAERHLAAAADAAERLAAGESDVPFGVIGWDLEAAIDDARAALRRTLTQAVAA